MNSAKHYMYTEQYENWGKTINIISFEFCANKKIVKARGWSCDFQDIRKSTHLFINEGRALILWQDLQNMNVYFTWAEQASAAS